MTVDESYMTLYSGKRFYPSRIGELEVDIEDIAHALSLLCRFAGHTSKHYSVAEHCVRVATHLRISGSSRPVQLLGLLHDATEAYVVDLPSPIKHLPEMKSYRDLEDAIAERIGKRFGLSPLGHAQVKAADLYLLDYESEEFLGSEGRAGWKAEFAEARYLALFHVLTEAEGRR